MLGVSNLRQTSQKLSLSSNQIPSQVCSRHVRPRRGVPCSSTPKWKRSPSSMGSDPDDLNQRRIQPASPNTIRAGADLNQPDPDRPLYQSPSSRNPSDADPSPEEVANQQRDRAAAAAADNVSEAGEQFGSVAGEGVKAAESVLADAQGQVARAASEAAERERFSSDTTSFGQRAARTAASASAASADTRAGREEDAARTEAAVEDATSQVSQAAASTVRSIPTAAEAVRGVGGGAAGALRGLSQAGSQVSSAAEEFQRNADGLASDVQRRTESKAQDLQDRVNRVSAKAETTAQNLRRGTTPKRGKPLISESTPLTRIAEGGSDDISVLKTKLLAHVAGLDRGFAATRRQTQAVKAVINELVDASKPVNLMPAAAVAPAVTVQPTPGAPPAARAATAPGVSPATSTTPPGVPPTTSTTPPGTPPTTSTTTSRVGPTSPPTSPSSAITPPPRTAPVPAVNPDPDALPASGVASPGSAGPGLGGPGTTRSSVTDSGTIGPAGTGPATTGPSSAGPGLTNTGVAGPGPVGPGPTAPGPTGQGSSAYGSEAQRDSPSGPRVSSGKGTNFIAGDSSSENVSELGGLWRLVYSSGFARRNTGGARPGVPISLLPAQFGQVYQDIDTDNRRLDNVVELRRPALPVPPFVPIKPLPAEALLTLKHSLTITSPTTVSITATGTDVNLQGGLGGILNAVPQFELPDLPEQLKPPRASRSATFEVLFLDEDIRITRGDRKELRVFLRV